MSKDISANLLTSIRQPNATIATCVEIRRRDGRVIRMTNHDTDLVVDDNLHRHDIPFQLSAIASGTSMATDNTQLTLFAADDGPITSGDFRDGLYDHADIRIYEVDYENLAYGKMTLRKGWFGPVDRNQYKKVEITVTGLLKILDFEVGRVYQPSCDADLGDHRCKIAVRQSQVYSSDNPFNVGDWVYKYDPALMTAFGIVNPSFEDDGTRTVDQAITGWTKITGTLVEVEAGAAVSGDVLAHDGTYRLSGADDILNPASNGQESGLYQDLDLVAEGLDTGDIDDGQISVLMTAALANLLYLLDLVRIRYEVMDADGEILDAQDTGYIAFDDFDTWRERSLAGPIFPGARTIRIYVYFRKEDGISLNVAADNIRMWWWNHTAGNPYDQAIHQLVRIVDYTDGNTYYGANNSFESNGDVANALSPTITGWVTTGSWWKVDNDLHMSLPALDGTRYLIGGDDGGSSQQTYTITRTFNLTAANVELTRVQLGKVVGKMELLVGFGDIGASAATVIIDFLDNANTIVDTINVLTAEMGTSIEWITLGPNFTIDIAATKIRVTLQAISPVGDGAALIAFDALKFYFFDAERSTKQDPIRGFGDGQPFNTTPGTYTLDGNLVWKGAAALVQYDTVAAVTSRKEFNGTLITGADGTYETGVLTWLSGDNAGLRNVIRTWDPDTKALKTYFRAPHDIQVGDRFMYVRSCQKRFLEDCRGIFNNQINFRGFPHLPGKLTSPEGT